MNCMRSIHKLTTAEGDFTVRRRFSAHLPALVAVCSVSKKSFAGTGPGSQTWGERDDSGGGGTLGVLALALMFFIAYGFWLRHLDRKKKIGVGILGLLFQLFIGPALIFAAILHLLR